jgi:hypothetical protein
VERAWRALVAPLALSARLVVHLLWSRKVTMMSCARPRATSQISPDTLRLLLGGGHAVLNRPQCGVRQRHWLRRQPLGLDEPVDFGLGSFELGGGRGEVGFGGNGCQAS